MHVQLLHRHHQLASRHPVNDSLRPPNLQLKHLLRRTPPGGPDSGGGDDTDSSGGGGDTSDSSGGSDSGGSDSGSGSSSSSSSNSATTSCTDSDSGACQRLTQDTATSTLPIVLAVVLPIVIALAVIFALHRRHVKRLRQEDASDKYKSYDFGLSDVHIESPPDNAQSMAMSEREKGLSSKHGVSLECLVLDPVALPPPSQIHDRDTMSLAPSINGRSATNPFDDPYNMDPKNSSSSSTHTPLSNINQSRSLTPTTSTNYQPHDVSTQSACPTDSRHSSGSSSLGASTITPGHKPQEAKEDPNVPVSTISHTDPDTSNDNDHSDYDLRDSTQSLEKSQTGPLGSVFPEVNPDDGKPITNRISIVQPPPGYQLNPNRLTQQGIRPLPPDDPNETDEQRTTRIRSFYKDYFDPNNPNGARNSHYQSGQPLEGESSIFEENSGRYHETPSQYISGASPFGQPPPRRAMTPPPGMISIRESDFTLPLGSLPIGQVSSRPSSPSVRIGSSISNRPPPNGPLPPPPRRRQPPPQPLNILPTPAKLGDDSVLTMTSGDFAPSRGRKLNREGKTEGLLGGRISYSQNVPVHMPLASSYDDLALVPSP